MYILYSQEEIYYSFVTLHYNCCIARSRLDNIIIFYRVYVHKNYYNIAVPSAFVSIIIYILWTREGTFQRILTFVPSTIIILLLILIFFFSNFVFSDPPVGQPLLSLEKRHYTIGDTLKGNCTSPPSSPPSNVTWYLNDKWVRPSYNIVINNTDGVWAVVLPSFEAKSSTYGTITNRARVARKPGTM